jgi:hypothetical protein
MSKPFRKIVQQEYERLKKVLEHITNNVKKQNKPALVLQPVRNKKY